MLELEAPAVLGARFEEVLLRADIGGEAHDDFFADGVYGRIRDLREELLEVFVGQPRTLGEDCKRRIVSHRPERLLAVLGHRFEQKVQVLLGIPEHAQPFLKSLFVP